MEVIKNAAVETASGEDDRNMPDVRAAQPGTDLCGVLGIHGIHLQVLHGRDPEGKPGTGTGGNGTYGAGGIVK